MLEACGVFQNDVFVKNKIQLNTRPTGREEKPSILLWLNKTRQQLELLAFSLKENVLEKLTTLQIEKFCDHSFLRDISMFKS